MTATPIPRSLALIVYGELDISIIKQNRPIALPIITKIWSPVSRNQLYQAIDAQIAEGRQAYVICRLIDDNPANEAKVLRLNSRNCKTRYLATVKLAYCMDV